MSQHNITLVFAISYNLDTCVVQLRWDKSHVILK